MTLPHISRQAFSLLELLVVLVMLAMLTGVVTLALSDRQSTRVATQEALRFYKIADMAADQAILDGIDIGVVVEKQRYHFVYYDTKARSWQPYPQTGFAPHPLPRDVTLTWRLESSLTSASLTDDIPPIIFESSGHITPFAVDFKLVADHTSVRRILSDGFNGVALETPQ